MSIGKRVKWGKYKGRLIKDIEIIDPNWLHNWYYKHNKS